MTRTSSCSWSTRLSMKRVVATVAVLLLAGSNGAPVEERQTGDEAPTVYDTDHNVTYVGLVRNGIEIFLNIQYGADTSGENRFRPPKPAPVPEPGSTIYAQNYGPACPQVPRNSTNPTELSIFNQTSEDCLNLNVARPKNWSPGKDTKLLPVMVYIHGGSFWVGWNGDLSIAPDGLVLQADENKTPIIHVAMNYRLGVFGFAQSSALRFEGSENAGLRDQRLALDWVRHNIAYFGGDPDRVTIFGQSSGGASVGMHLLAFGGTKPVLFHQAICQSQALALGITGNYSRDGMLAVTEATGCNITDFDSPETIACLRGLDTATLFGASEDTWQADPAHNGGDLWLPSVDGDFLPAPPSQLLREGRFAAVPRDVSAVMMGWTDDDTTQFTDREIKTAEDTQNFISESASGVSPQNIDTLLDLYPISDFWGDPAAGLSAEFYRSARITRDMMMVCQPIFLGSSLIAAVEKTSDIEFDVYLYDWNQTVLGPALQSAYNETGLGAIHTSEFAYIFGNINRYNVEGYLYEPQDADWVLERRGSRSWAAFATRGRPGTRSNDIRDDDIFQSFEPGFSRHGELEGVYVIGGPNYGWGLIESDDGDHQAEISSQRLKERCGFLNSDEMIEQLRY